MLHDDQLDTLIETARARYHAPPDPDLDRLWAGIEARRNRRPAVGFITQWWRPMGVAAGLALAFSLGRMSNANTTAPPAEVASLPHVDAMAAPVTDVASDLLGQTAALLTALPMESRLGDRAFARQAGDLLLTTRLLLDAPGTQRNPALSTLLQDLELVLAQVARLQQGDAAPRREIDLITDALRQQDLVPRIRTIAAGLQAGAD